MICSFKSKGIYTIVKIKRGYIFFLFFPFLSGTRNAVLKGKVKSGVWCGEGQEKVLFFSRNAVGSQWTVLRLKGQTEEGLLWERYEG